MSDNVTAMPVAPVEADKRRTITLTNRAPIQIVESNWPVLAEGRYGWDDPCADGTGWAIQIRVREDRYGEHIIHANYDYCTENGEDDQRVRVGRVINQREAAGHLWKHMQEVAEELRIRIDSERLHRYVTTALDHCFANLKPSTY